MEMNNCKNHECQFANVFSTNDILYTLAQFLRIDNLVLKL